MLSPAFGLREGTKMAKPQDLKALRNLIVEAETLLATTELPDGRAVRAHELLTSAISLADALIEVPPAAVIGRKGGLATKKRGSEYFRQIAAQRKTKSGGRPRKNHS